MGGCVGERGLGLRVPRERTKGGPFRLASARSPRSLPPQPGAMHPTTENPRRHWGGGKISTPGAMWGVGYAFGKGLHKKALGFRLRAVGALGGYNYKSKLLPKRRDVGSTNFDGQDAFVAALIGYQFARAFHRQALRRGQAEDQHIVPRSEQFGARQRLGLRLQAEAGSICRGVILGRC